MTKARKSYNLALSIYSHVRHGDYKGARYLLLELITIVEEICTEEEATIKALETQHEVKASKK